MLFLSFIMIHVGYEFELDRTRLEDYLVGRLALCIGMWPRGEVGAGVLILSLGYGITGPSIAVGTLSLALNLVATGLFIAAVKKLLRSAPAP